MWQAVTEKEAQYSKSRRDDERSTGHGKIEEYATRYRAHGYAKAGCSCLLAKLPTLCVSGFGRDPVGEDR